MSDPNIINIQKFSVHDGKGIRTTVFFKGCPLACAWCHNPESQVYRQELMVDAQRCVGCGSCIPACPQNAICRTVSGRVETDREKCTVCGACVSRCLYGARSIVGEQIPVKELVRRLVRDRMFYETSGGGVTLSGGEVMSQNMGYLLELLKDLHEEDISVNIDTCGDVPYENLQAVLPYTDTFLYDMKAVTPELHLTYTGQDNRRILENLKRLSLDGAKINLRIPVIGVNSSDEEIRKMIDFVRDNDIHLTQVNLLPYHKAGSDKGSRLGRTDCKEFTPPPAERMEYLKKMCLDAGFSSVLIGG